MILVFSSGDLVPLQMGGQTSCVNAKTTIDKRIEESGTNIVEVRCIYTETGEVR